MFVVAYDNTTGNIQVSINSSKKYFLPRFKIENYNIQIDRRNFYDQPINYPIKKYGAKSEKYQQGNVMIIQLVDYWILLILKKIPNSLQFI